MKIEGGVIFNKVITHYPASGYRNRASGAFNNVGTEGDAWSSAVTGVNGYNLNFHSTNVNPQNNASRSYGLPVRCVQHLQVCLPVRVLQYKRVQKLKA